ncbi:tripartite motif-containing protein 10-like isoform X2 [Hemicordylus capensis]|uniref:tripartite motif-containing protein 10-like isoform X2 n=1 Tax=Hemicordylus capensis TaxID=884348 RepID=UPI00230327B5|nr:tripartite motif-containing protein 10-like isoform X2 [Hemicordylus capensis]
MDNLRDSVSRLQDEVICTICLEYYTDPVILNCGHNFCQSCVVQYLEDLSPNVICPQCEEAIQEKSFKPNKQLSNVAEIFKQLSCQAQKEAGGPKERLCKKHLEPLKLFCEEDEALICVVCRESQHHSTHRVSPTEEAAKEHKGRISSLLEAIKEAREKTVGFISSKKEESEELLRQAKTDMQTVVAEFKELHQFLEEQERLFLARVEKVNKEVVKKREKHVAELSEEISSCDSFIQEIEEKCKQPAEEFLQDIKSISQRCKEKEQKKVENPIAFRPGLKHKIQDISYQIPSMKRIVQHFRASLTSTCQMNRNNLTLDPETAHPVLHLTENRKHVQWNTKWMMLPTSSLRFATEACVLGSDGFASGKHSWGVEIEEEEGGWAVGVAKESINRKGIFRISTEEGIWALQDNGTAYSTSPSPFQVIIKLMRKPRRILVFLDYEQGQVAFSDAETNTMLFIFPQVSFSGEKMYPWFKVGHGSILRLWT